MASKKLSTDTSLANSYKLSRGVASVARPSAPTIGTATDTGSGLMSVTFTASTLGPTASSFTLTSSSGVTASGASSPLTLQELAIGTYTYSVYGTNANGNGPSSAASNSVVVASVYGASFDSIATYTVGVGGSTSISFTGIPSTYQHLQLRATMRGSTQDVVKVTLNNDTASNYTQQILYGTGTGALGIGSYNSTSYYLTRTVGIPTGANIFATTIVDIYDYTNTSKNKTMKDMTMWDANGSGYIGLESGSWVNTSAVNRLDLTFSTIQQYSKFALYGIKG